MIVATCISFLVLVQLAVCATQTPPVTDCSGSENPAFQVTSVTIKHAELGKKIEFLGTVVVNRVMGNSPVLYVSFATPDGSELPCVESLFPCELKTCNGTTRIEKRLNADWDNKCPVQPGTYKAPLEFRLPNSEDAKDYFKDGNLVATFNVIDEGKVLGCVSVPVAIDID